MKYNSLRNSGENIVNKSYDFNDKKTKIIYVELINQKKLKSSKELGGKI